ncbi:unnamed protein product [Brachionus calyciflorus]|uniref:Uncharacterized protein n=1 Tax=Brachionus calyciflorus TaxID=104777 RepID=A0A813WAS4_9BILA|nr:unnamed protein product [Brachionus calyciflorus]
MAVEIFKKTYIEARNDSNIFSFENLRNNLNIVTPQKKEKIPLTYSLDYISIYRKSKESIIRNLCLNPILIQKPDFHVSILRPLFDFFVDENFSESRLAQSMYLLHGSKCDLSSVDLTSAIIEIRNYLLFFESIDTKVNTDEYKIFNDFLGIFTKLINSSLMPNIINRIIDKIVDKPSKKFDFNNIKLVFFKSDINELDGFSGPNIIYANTKPLLNFYKLKIDEKIKSITLKLNFLALVLHEISHVVLRFKLDNLNLSSPFLDDSNNGKDIKLNVMECGYEVEKEFFTHVIDWFASVNNLDVDYCERYLESILNDNYIQIDIEKAHLEINQQENLSKMAFRYHLRKHLHRF